MQSYEVVREVENLCANNQMRDIFFCALFSRFLLPSVGFCFFLSSFFVLYMLF